MKGKLLLLTATTSVVLFSCGQPSTNSSPTTVDTVSRPHSSDPLRPNDEVILVKKLWDADSVLKLQTNDIGRQSVADSARADVSNYLTNILNAKVNNWIAYVGDMTANGSHISLRLLIPKNWNLANNSHPDFTSVNLLVDLNSDADKTIVNMLKPLLQGDRVTISGKFEKNGKKVDIDANQLTMLIGEHMPETVLEDPWYDFKITDIKPYSADK